jgi:hypothetical protein
MPTKFFTKKLIIIWSKQRNENTSIQIFENLNYLIKNIVSVSFTLVSYAYLLSGLSPHIRYAYFGQEFLSSKLANHSFTHENCGA